ncbi:MAG: hypothetical protein H6741_24545 [Alphaproteobacteria bacterium]|nr:hypothetical protein [Alphaproteobacteria bacterium]
MRTAFLLVVGALGALTACDDEFNYNKSHGSSSDGYDADLCGVQQMFEDSCYTCHSAAAATAGLDLETDVIGATVDVASAGGGALVIAGDADNSVLYLKAANLTPSGEGGVMPPGSEGLGEAALDALATWIDNGAADDCGAGGDSGAR